MLLLAVTLIAVFAQTNAQCLTHVKYTASKMEMLDSTMTSTGTKDASFIFETTEKGFTGTPDGNDDEALQGTLKKLTCDWKQPYINGKIVMVCDVHNSHEDIVDATITIEAVDGKITIILHANEYPDKIIKLLIDKYEEVK